MSDLNRQQRKSGTTELYRHFDANGVLLYVGISFSTAKRLGEHRCGSAWWRKVASITIQRYRTREAALKAELKAIQTEKPLHNVTGKTRGFRVGGQYKPYVDPVKAEVDAIMAAFRAKIAAETGGEEPC